MQEDMHTEFLQTIPEVEGMETPTASSSTLSNSSQSNDRRKLLKTRLNAQAETIRDLQDSAQQQAELQSILKATITTPGPLETPRTSQASTTSCKKERHQFSRKSPKRRS
jgi:hypothetical protein